VALTPNPHTLSILDFQVSNPGPLGLIFGAEGPGLPDETLTSADVQLHIPIAHDVDSLNVGHAAAVAFALTTPKQNI